MLVDVLTLCAPAYQQEPWCVILTLLLLIQILVPAIVDFEAENELSEPISANQTVTFSEGNSHEFAGDNLDYRD